MRGIATFPDAAGVSADIVFGTFSFGCNATSSPLAASYLGSLTKRVQSITYGATGLFTVTMVPGFTFFKLPIIEPSNSCADGTGTNQFYCALIGVPTQTVITTGQGLQLRFVIGCFQGTTAFAPPATAGNSVQFSIEGINESNIGI
jgi:hypothetical protein